jgi:hypothetical protein
MEPQAFGQYNLHAELIPLWGINSMNFKTTAFAACALLFANFCAVAPASAATVYTTKWVCRSGTSNVAKEITTVTYCWYETTAYDSITGDSSVAYSWFGDAKLPTKISVPDAPSNNETDVDCGSDTALRLSHALKDVNPYLLTKLFNPPAAGSIMVVTYPSGQKEGWTYTGTKGDMALIPQPNSLFPCR